MTPGPTGEASSSIPQVAPKVHGGKITHNKHVHTTVGLKLLWVAVLSARLGMAVHVINFYCRFERADLSF